MFKLCCALLYSITGQRASAGKAVKESWVTKFEISIMLPSVGGTRRHLRLRFSVVFDDMPIL